MKKLLILCFSLVALFALASCDKETTNTTAFSSENETTTEIDRKLVVYMSGPESMINSLESTFENTAGDVLDITIYSCGQLRDKVWTESQSGEIEADIFFGSDPILFNKLDANNLLEPLTLAESNMIESKYVVQDHNYAIVVERYLTIMSTTDTTRLNTEPTSYSELGNSEYDGVFAMADASLSATAFAVASSFYEISGFNMDLLNSLNNNNVILAKSNGSVPSGIIDGTYDLGIAPHDSFIRLSKNAVKNDYELELKAIWPTEGAISLVRPVAIAKNVNRSDALTDIAKDFVDFLLSTQGQTIQYNNGFISVRSDIENGYLPDGVTVIDIDWEYAATNEETFKSAYEDIFKN